MQRDRLLRLLDRSQDAAFGLTRDAEIWSWNHAAERLFGYSAEQALKRPFGPLLEPRGSLGNLVDDRYCRFAIATGSVPSFDMQVKARSGQLIWVNVTVLVFEALRTSPPVVVHLAHDITVAKLREQLAHELVETARRVVAVPNEAHELGPVSPLSEKEQRVLRAFMEGAMAPEVARLLKISEQTLRNHLHHINQKLGTHNRLEAVTHAIRRKLI